MKSLNAILAQAHAQYTLKSLRNFRSALLQGHKIQISLCRGSAFTYRDFSVKLDTEKELWSDSCQFWGGKKDFQCMYCAEYENSNIRALAKVYPLIADFSKISFSNGVIDLSLAMKHEEKPEEKPAAKKKAKGTIYDSFNNPYYCTTTKVSY